MFTYAPASLQAEYIVTKYAESLSQNPQLNPGLVTKALRYPICSQDVLEAIFRLPQCPSDIEHSRVELPRRLFRSIGPRVTPPWSSDDHPLPFLRHLYQHARIPKPHVDSWDGYPLTKAVASRHIPLVRFLLDQGASPALKSGIAVHVAIRLKDLALVKLLIEPSDFAAASGAEASGATSARVEIRRRKQLEAEGKNTKKRRKLEDRVEVTQEMLQTAVACNARDIVEYFMQDKACMPDVHTVKLISAGGAAATRRKKRRAER